ncbi:MAG: glycosyltransferase family 4 protein [Pirellulaceae bacterium]
MKILIVHQYFLGKDDAGGSRWNQFAKYWADAGHEITILAGTVHYNSGEKPAQYRGKFVVREDVQPGVTVYRCYVSESYNKSFAGRAWAYLSFAVSSTYAGLFKADRPDVILATSPPLTVAMTMSWLKFWRRRPAVFEVRDLWPESALDTGVIQPGRLADMLFRLERKAYRRADWINVLTPAFEQALVEKKHVDPTKISMIPNGADLDIMIPGERDNQVRRELGLNGKFVVSYFGAHGRANRVGQLLDVAEKLKSSAPDVRIMLVGDGMEKSQLVEDARRRELDNVIFVDSVAKERVCDYINASDVCTAVLMRNDTFKTVYPNKVFDYMSCRRPIIIAIDGVARKLVEDAGAGYFAEPEDPAAFVDVLLKLKDEPEARQRMGESGYRYAAEHYSRKAMAQKYLEVLERLVEG